MQSPAGPLCDGLLSASSPALERSAAWSARALSSVTLHPPFVPVYPRCSILVDRSFCRHRTPRPPLMTPRASGERRVAQRAATVRARAHNMTLESNFSVNSPALRRDGMQGHVSRPLHEGSLNPSPHPPRHNPTQERKKIAAATGKRVLGLRLRLRSRCERGCGVAGEPRRAALIDDRC